MPRHSALIVVASIAALALAPAAASADPAASQITTPSGPSFVTADVDQPGSIYVAGTTSGGDGNVDLRCYFGDTSVRLVSDVPVDNGSFAAAPAVDATNLAALGYPAPYCTLRAVPAGTVPVAPPGADSAWSGPALGWGEHRIFRVGEGNWPTSPDTVWDYGVSRAQSRAFSDYNGASACGLCDTYLFKPGTKAISNPIWGGNAGLFRWPRNVGDRTGVLVDGFGAYAGFSAHHTNGEGDLIDNAGFPTVSMTDHVDPGTGDTSIDERSEWKRCAPEPALFPTTDASCSAFSETGVVLDRQIRQTDDGLRVTIVDHWKSVDGMPHELDAMYEDVFLAENAFTPGREGRADFTWTHAGFGIFEQKELVPPPDTVPATLLVKGDATTPDGGDGMNPFGAVVYGSRPTEIYVDPIGTPDTVAGRWHTRYARTIPAGGEVDIAMAYVHDFALGDVKARAEAAEADLAALVPPPAASAPPRGDGSPASEPAPSSAAVQPAASADPGVVTKPAGCVVPKLRGKTLATGKRLLVRAHCSLGKVSRKATTKVKPGRVLATSFKAGTHHRAGTRIRVTVAKAG